VFVSERQELARLIKSCDFEDKQPGKALRYLCEKHWEGEQVTQYDLSQELYGDIENMVNVRNLVMRLRKTLKLYYATDGKGAALQLEIPKGGYKIIFHDNSDVEDVGDGVELLPKAAEQPEPAAAPPGCPVAEGDGAVARNTRPLAGLLTVLTVASILIVVVVILQAYTKGRRGVAQNLAFKANLVIGQTDENPNLWSEIMPGPVFKTLVLDDGSVNRFAVLCGGLETPYSPPAEVPPMVVILSPRGEVLETLNLLEYFNPFIDTHDPRYFRFYRSLTLDFEPDGHQDLLVTCNHLFYPSLIFAISGRRCEITGAFANSGFIVGLVPIEPEGSIAGPGVVGVAINNRMGEQYTAFKFHFWRRRVSPDMDPGGAEVMYNYRPTGLVRLSSQSWSLESGNILKINGLNRTCLFDVYNASLDSDPWPREDKTIDKVQNGLLEFYTMVVGGRQSIEAGMVDEGQNQYDEAMAIAFDGPLRHYVWLDAVRALQNAGLAREALERLSEDPDDLLFPRRRMILRGELLTILGDYEEARQAFLNAEFSRYSFKGFVQACILEGMSGEELGRQVTKHYAAFTGLRATAAWLKIPALLRGEATDESILQDDMPSDPAVNNAVEDSIRYPEEPAFWNACVDLDKGIEPQVWPDENNGPIEYSDIFPLKIKLVDALQHLAETGPEAALPLLESSYRAFAKAATRDVEAISPFVLVAYACGFAADEAGRPDLAREALEEAVVRFPRGSKYLRALEILGRSPESH